MADNKSRIHRARPHALVVGLQLAATEPDDDTVLIDGVLRSKEWVSKMAAKSLFYSNGNVVGSAQRRYKLCYPEHDASTPTFKEFRDDTKPPRR